MVQQFCTTINVPSHAMGHVIGRFGQTIRNIRNLCGVITMNENYHPYQKADVRMTIQGYSREAIQQAIFMIDDQVAISAEWCRKNQLVFRK